MIRKKSGVRGRIGIVIKPERHRRMKILATESGVSMRELLERWIDERWAAKAKGSGN